VSVFAGSVTDAWRVSELAAGFDPEDVFSRAAPPGHSALPTAGFRFGVPRELEFFGDAAARAAFRGAVSRLEQLGGSAIEIDFAPFRQAAELLYQGPWLAERALAFGEHVARDAEGVDPTVAAIVRGAGRHSALDAFRAHYRLQELRRAADEVWREIDVLVVPTTATSYTHAQIAAQPIELNSRLGTYTNFTNLLDLCGIALPAGFKAERLPFGVTLLAPAFCDRALMQLGQRWEQSAESTVGATGIAVAPAVAVSNAARPAAPCVSPPARARQSIRLAVVGAHLTGQPLHRELLELGARLDLATRTTPRYRLYALANTAPAKPGLVRVSTGGTGIELEVYRLDAAAFGQFVANVGAPLGIGNVELESGEWVKGFLCEAIATEGAQEISQFGGWRGYLASRR
jgi:allophanate hydrolase